MEINFNLPEKATETRVYLVGEKLELSKSLKDFDERSGNFIKKLINKSEFTGKKGKALTSFTNDNDIERIILIGTGENTQKNPEMAIRDLGAKIRDIANHARIEEISVIIDQPIYGYAEGIAAANIAFGADLKSYRFDKYFTKQKEEDKPKLNKVNICLASHNEAIAKFKAFKAVADGVRLARDLVTEPPNVLYPESYANIIKDEMKPLGVKVEIFDKKDLTKMGAHALLGVAQGSVKDARMVVMTYNGAEDKKAQPVCLVGKGVTFDTGGISLKPSNGMEDMKYDMGGSAAVVGAMKAIAGRGAKTNVVAVVGLVENMPDGNAQRPSDVVTSMSGQTIEVLNTDAEGRLVLADCLWYAQEKLNPKLMIDFATLTGAVVVALGQWKAGIMSNDDELAEQLCQAGENSGDYLWKLPLGDEYDKQINSPIADMQNISNMKGAGTVTAGQFLQRFVNEKKWAHVDIAGVAWAEKDKYLVPKGATGFGVQLVDTFIAENYE